MPENFGYEQWPSSPNEPRAAVEESTSVPAAKPATSVSRLLRLLTVLLFFGMAATSVTLYAGWKYTAVRYERNVIVSPTNLDMPTLATPSKQRTRPPVAPPAGDGGYKFLDTNRAGLPIGYDPCRPIKVVVSTSGAPADAMATVATALKELNRSTGLDFELEGTTNEVAVEHRAIYQPSLYGDRWAPVLVAWTGPEVITELAGSAVGLGGSTAVTTRPGARAFYESGFVYLDGAQLSDTEQEKRANGSELAVLTHELGHVAGLDHVNDPGQLMNPVTSGIATFQAGDLRGLAIIGAIACSTTPH